MNNQSLKLPSGIDLNTLPGPDRLPPKRQRGFDDFIYYSESKLNFAIAYSVMEVTNNAYEGMLVWGNSECKSNRELRIFSERVYVFGWKKSIRWISDSCFIFRCCHYDGYVTHTAIIAIDVLKGYYLF
jgi:hypothetical protein